MARSDGWQCPICLSDLERPVLASCCGQSFCRACLDAALQQVDACPMCRSPLLSGPFSVTPNRTLEQALAALASSSSPLEVLSSGDENMAVWERKSAYQVQISDESSQNSSNLGENEQSWRWREYLSWGTVAGCRRGRRMLGTQSAELRRRFRQWNLWCRVNWTTLQCVFYVLLFFVFVFFLRVQEEDFADSTNNLRRPH